MNSLVAKAALVIPAARTNNVQKPRPVRCAAADASEAQTPKRKPSPLEAGGTLSGAKAAGKDAGAAALAALDGKDFAPATAVVFNDSRWENGCWKFEEFAGPDGETDWNAVIDAEVRRRKILEDFPEACDENEPVTFDLSMIPWKVWVTRFHLPEAESVNGRAAMIGFVSAYLVDLVFHVSIADQMNSFLGKFLLFATVVGCAFVRRNEDLTNLQGLADEATFYDKQWQASWEGVERPSEKQQ